MGRILRSLESWHDVVNVIHDALKQIFLFRIAIFIAIR